MANDKQVSPLQPRHWWHSATVYQIYPASFRDSNKDGWGDIKGIIEKADHLANLGVDVVWLSPCYKSPFADFGYDISDYREIDPRFGTVADIESLISALKARNIKLLLDLVVNHTSNEHSWFKESRSSIDSPKRDWYIWRKGKTTKNADGTVSREPPNNWESCFKGSVWEYDATTDEWYLHLFAKEQPDLNWENEEVRQAVYADMRFWLDKGIGGFRMDVINMISKPPGLPDAPITNPNAKVQPAEALYCNGPRVHEFLQELRRETLDRYDDIMTVGEVPDANETSIVRKYVAPDRKELCMLFEFSLFKLDHGPEGRFTRSSWTLKDFKSIISKWQQALPFSSGAWQTTFLESHDLARSVSRFGDGTAENRFKVAKVLAMLETTLAGTLFLHQGQEIGIANLATDIPISDYGDIETNRSLEDFRQAREAANPGKKVELQTIVDELGDQVRLKARDHGRMPIPWDGKKPHAGFSDATDGTKPWAVVNTDFEQCNVAQQEHDPDSALNFWRSMLKFRREHAEALIFGEFVQVSEGDSPVFAYHRTPPSESAASEKTLLVVLNLTKGNDVDFEIPVSAGGKSVEYTVLRHTTSADGEGTAKYKTGDRITLKAYEGLVLAC